VIIKNKYVANPGDRNMIKRDAENILNDTFRYLIVEVQRMCIVK
jgi:hypothetical protein